MIHATLQILRVQSCQEIKEILPWRPFVLGIFVREVLLEMGILFEHWINVADGQLLVVGNLNVLDLALLEEGLPAAEHILEEIFVYHPFVRQIVLDYRSVKQETI